MPRATRAAGVHLPEEAVEMCMPEVVVIPEHDKPVLGRPCVTHYGGIPELAG